MIRLYAVNILPLKDEGCFKACYLRSSKERQQKADVLQMPSDKARCIAAGLLLEYAYEKFRIEKTKELACANSFGYVQNPVLFPDAMPRLVEGMRGKPEFAWSEDYDTMCFFNLSHSGNYVICAMADFEVGADVQRRTRVRGSVLRQFFSKQERMFVEACGEDEVLRERAFSQVWTRKEAETKLTGRGIGQMLGKMMRDAGMAKCSEESENYRIWQGVIGEEYAWAVAAYPEETVGESDILQPTMVNEGELFYEGIF